MNSKIKNPIGLFGYALILSAILLILYLFIVLTQIVTNPSSIPIVEALVGTTDLGDGLGTLITVTNQNDKYEIRIYRSFMYFLYFVSGAMLIGALAILLRTLISSGVALIRCAQNTTDNTKKPNEQGPDL